MKVTYDPATDVAYIDLAGLQLESLAATVTIKTSASINLDLDSHGRLVGIELLRAQAQLHPDLMAAAVVPGAEEAD